MGKSQFSIGLVPKKDCTKLLNDFHYLSKVEGNKSFKSGFNFGLTCEGNLVGVCIYTGFPVPELVKGCFGLERDDQKGFFELSRLVLSPEPQTTEHNLASWFVSKTLRLLRCETRVRAVLSYADNDFHSGTVYAASNFSYHGKTAKKADFWIQQDDDSFEKHKRGKTKGVSGEWRPRTQKHRFLRIYDKKLVTLWPSVIWKPNTTTKEKQND